MIDPAVLVDPAPLAFQFHATKLSVFLLNGSLAALPAVNTNPSELFLMVFSLGAHDFISLHYSTRYSLYLLWRTPPQQDAAIIGG